MRSLYSGVSGLRVHQTKMDVIGNNIANVNTIGFKSSSVQFTDILYQTTKNASGPNSATGTAGTNSQQIGLGASVAAIKTNITQAGGAQRTDSATDLMINGDAFFVVNKDGQNYFTKAGAFTFDAAGNLAMESGAIVQGWKADDKGNIVKTAVTALDVLSEKNSYADPEATTKAYVTGNIDKADTQLTSGGVPYQISIYDNLGTKYTVKMSITDTGTSTTDGKYKTSITDIVDSDGNSLFVNQKADGTYEDSKAQITLGGVTYKVATVDATTGDFTLSTTGTDANTINFDPTTGKFKSVGTGTDTSINLTVQTTPNTFPTTPITVDYSTMTQFAEKGTSSVNGYAGDTSGDGAGRKSGNISGVTIDSEGKIYGKYDNDTTKLLGQIAVASFSNPAGLESIGGNLFAATVNSGSFDGIGQEITTGGGSFTAGALEMSNVDLAQEFTEMITTQRGFQANSRIITTSDSMLEELISLKR